MDHFDLWLTILPANFLKLEQRIPLFKVIPEFLVILLNYLSTIRTDLSPCRLRPLFLSVDTYGTSDLIAEKARAPEIHQTRKGNEWRFGMKCHVGVDAGSGLVHTITVTSANNAQKQCAKNALCFFFLHDFIHTIFRAKSTPPLHLPAHRIHSVR